MVIMKMYKYDKEVYVEKVNISKIGGVFKRRIL